MSTELVDIGTLKGGSNERQRKTVQKHATKFFQDHPDIIKNGRNFSDCTAEDLDDGIIGKFADWLVKDKNTKIKKYTAHDQYVSQFKTFLEEDPRFRTKVIEWTKYYAKLR